MTGSTSGAIVRRLWSLLTMRASEYTGSDPSRFDRLHMIADPYELTSPREIARYEQTNQAIARAGLQPASILDIAAGEGTQTRYLARIAPVTAIEVSPRAVARARAALPDTEFLVGRAEDVLTLVGERRFDLAVICELLYLTQNAAQIIADAQRVARAIIVTNYAKRAPALEPLLSGPGWERLDDISAEGTVWRCYLWRASPPADGAAAPKATAQ